MVANGAGLRCDANHLLHLGRCDGEDGTQGGHHQTKYFSPETTMTTVHTGLDPEGKITTVPAQQFVPPGYEVDTDDGCRFAVPEYVFRQVPVGGRITYRESRGIVYHDCDWNPQ